MAKPLRSIKIFDSRGNPRYLSIKCLGCNKPMIAGRKRCAECSYEAKKIPIEKRFWKYVRKTSNCWFWIGAKAGNGYGVTSTHINGKKTQVYAHRIAYEFTNGPIRGNLYALHKCDQPSCVNPEHLQIGDQSENMRDCYEKNRTARGGDLPQTKLTEKDVIEIRNRYKNGFVSYRKLAKEYGVTYSTVFLIVKRKNWNHVS